MKNRDDYITSIYAKKAIKAEEIRKKRKAVISVCLPVVACTAAAAILLPGFSKNKLQAAQDVQSIESGTLLSEENYSYLYEFDTTDYDVDVFGEGYGSIELSSVTTTQPAGTTVVQETAVAQTSKATVTAAATTTGSRIEKQSTHVTAATAVTAVTEIAIETAPIRGTTITRGTTPATGSASHTTPNTTTVYSTTTKSSATTTTTPDVATQNNLINVTVESSGSTSSASSSGMTRIYQAFSWTLDNSFYGYENADSPTGKTYKITFSFKNGNEKTVYWADGAISADGSQWHKLSDSQNGQLSSVISSY